MLKLSMDQKTKQLKNNVVAGKTRFTVPVPLASTGNRKFKLLLATIIISLKQKTNQILPATIEKIKFCLSKKTNKSQANVIA